MKQLAMMGGTFNPPHLGHIHAAESAAKMLGLDKVLFMPSKIPPHKLLPEGTPSPEIRLEMTGIAISDNDLFEVSDLELKREGRSYTAVTAKELSELYPDTKLWLIIGTDMLETFASWYHPEEILKYMSLAVVGRADGDEQKIVEAAEKLRCDLRAEVAIIETDALEISSTELRNMLISGQMKEAKRYLTDSVAEYILEKGLYAQNG